MVKQLLIDKDHEQYSAYNYRIKHDKTKLLLDKDHEQYRP